MKTKRQINKLSIIDIYTCDSLELFKTYEQHKSFKNYDIEKIFAQAFIYLDDKLDIIKYLTPRISQELQLQMIIQNNTYSKFSTESNIKLGQLAVNSLLRVNNNKDLFIKQLKDTNSIIWYYDEQFVIDQLHHYMNNYTEFISSSRQFKKNSKTNLVYNAIDYEYLDALKLIIDHQINNENMLYTYMNAKTAKLLFTKSKNFQNEVIKYITQDIKTYGSDKDLFNFMLKLKKAKSKLIKNHRNFQEVS